MRGKVVSYNSQIGKGKIIIKEEGVKVFDIKDWKSYETLPNVGLEVECEVDEFGNLISISTSDTTSLLNKLQSRISYKVPTNLRIQEDLSLEKCLNNFFSKYQRLVLKYKNYFESLYSLPYLKIKRFLFTAYNNLLEIDFHINDKHLIDSKNQLNELERYFNMILLENKNPISVMFEKVFLNKQNMYKKMSLKFDNNLKYISDSKSKSKSLEAQIKEIEKELVNYKTNSREYKEKENILKSYKKQYVDLIDNVQNLKDENSILFKDLVSFREAYKDIFTQYFKERIDILVASLKKELDACAYHFDTILWKNAKESKLVRDFFKKAKIEGGYSTKTFMQYYLRNLNNEKMTEKDSELLDIFNDLKYFSKHFIIFSKQKNKLLEISSEIENMDHNNNVSVFNSFKEFVFYIMNNDSKLDVVIIDIDSINYDTIKKVLPTLYKLGVKVVMFSNDKNMQGDNIIHASKLSNFLKNI